MKLGELIKSYREKTKLTMQEFASKAGLSKGYISMLEKNQHPQSQRPLTPSLDTYQKVASAMSLTLDELIAVLDGDETVRLTHSVDENDISGIKQIKAVRVPVLGRVQAGLPIDVQEEIIDWEEITPELASRGEFFGLKIKGDSMAPRILEGDVVIVRQQDNAECGDIVIAMVNGDEATIKKLIKHTTGGIALVAANPLYPPLQFTEEEIISKPVKILGKVVELRGKF